MGKTRMIKVAALTSGQNVPSSRFRIRQHIVPLGRAGVSIKEYIPAISKYSSLPTTRHTGKPYMRPAYGLWEGVKLLTRAPGLLGTWKADVSWLERELLPGRGTLERLIKRPYVWDVDDAIWMNVRGDDSWLKRIANNASVLVVVNDFVADWFDSHADDIRILPTAIDTNRWRPAQRDGRESFTIGWTGLSTNFRFLYEVEDALYDVLAAAPQGELLVIADKPPTFKRLDGRRVRFLEWSPEVEAEGVRQMDVGIMPLISDPWSEGKGSFKMLQYMSCGLPVVVSPVGMNRQVLETGTIGIGAQTNEEWTEALLHLCRDATTRAEMGARGRQVVEKHFSVDAIAPALVKVFQDVAG
ncbi:MAG: glycosyltransferase family 4 protein [Actinobacteria bacterium]|nr:glycosyltransferase family 4 protein [Actinomycetota bacterium]